MRYFQLHLEGTDYIFHGEDDIARPERTQVMGTYGIEQLTPGVQTMTMSDIHRYYTETEELI